MFVVARNPDEQSSLPYLLRLPIEGGIELKARERWPATARVYCHPAEGWPDDAEILEEVPIRRCERRGVAVDLVLDRGRENRSQFVFTKPHAGRAGGRPMIFWQTQRTVRRARPGQRVPRRRAATDGFVIEIDTRERYAYKFAARAVETARGALPVGDYAVKSGDELIAVVERKSLEDFAKTLVDGSLGFRMADLASIPAAAVVVEERYSALLKVEHVQPGWLLEVVAQLQARYPSVPIVFADSRKLGEEWTYRFLAAARAQHSSDG
ncbi:MAG: ERCC4 domain-containing protein [Solirubrobacteraceae bacterium]